MGAGMGPIQAYPPTPRAVSPVGPSESPWVSQCKGAPVDALSIGSPIKSEI